MRAIAIFLVIALHVSQRFAWGVAQGPKGVAEYFLLGRSADGVGIFFVLSGFLITHLLLREYEEKGRISLKDFYIRRAFRILPPFYTYLLFVLCFCALVHIPK